MRRIISFFVFTVCVVLIAFLFVDVDGPAPSLIYRQITNTGHIFLFFLLTSLWLRFQNPLKPKNTRTILIYAVLGGTLIGLAIELIQPFVGRDFSLFDLLRNTCGILLALAFNLEFSLFHNRKHLKLARIAAIAITSFVLCPLWFAIADRIIRHYQYPVLSNFDTPFENLRWSSNTKTRVINNSSSKVLEVTMWPRKGYNKVSLDYFYRDWSDSDALELDIYNSNTESRKISIRIHDNQHLLEKQAHSDRYNQSLILEPGWNTIHTSIEDIINAPADRKMVLRTMAEIQLFVKDLDENWIIWIDNVTLVRQQAIASSH